jgi:HEPN domain-containing protein
VSSPRDDLAEVSRTLFRKASGDAAATRDLAANRDIPDDIVGFHAQQAVEKWLKAVIAGRAETFEHTHDLRRLVNLAAHSLDAVPFDADAAIALTQYSVPLRYEDLLDAEPLDRSAAVELVNEVGEWAASQLRASGD